MYEKHFNFSENPFTIAPNPRYLYLTDRHREALAHLSYGLRENGGFILLTGEVGTGKTTVCRCLLERVPGDVRLAMVLTPTLEANELLAAICDEFGIDYGPGATSKALTDALNRYLLDVHTKGRRAVVVIDEAQNLATEVLEQLRLLTNLETNEHKLLQIILIGQPEFLAKLEQPEMRQLSQRIVARFHLAPLSPGEVCAYISHRLKIAGGSSSIFPKAVSLRVAQLSKGVPRLVNLLCDRALLGCYVQEQHEVDMKTLQRAAREVFGDRRLSRREVARARRAGTGRWFWLSAPVVAAAAAWLLLAGGLPERAEFPSLFERFKGADSVEVAEAPTPTPGESMPQGGYRGAAGDTAEPVEVAASAPPLTWEALVRAEHSEFAAYLALFNAWNVQYLPGSAPTPCGFAFREQLDCWHRRGRLRDLQHFNRPALLKMVSEQGSLFYAALLGVDGDRVRLGIGEREMEVPRGEVERRLTGEFTLLWRRPPGFTRTLRPGDKNEFVTWVADKLSQLDGHKVALRGSRVYGSALLGRVRNLQLRCGLRVDGLIGRETILVINALTANVPVLSTRLSRRCARRLNV